MPLALVSNALAPCKAFELKNNHCTMPAGPAVRKALGNLAQYQAGMDQCVMIGMSLPTIATYVGALVAKELVCRVVFLLASYHVGDNF